MVSTLHPRGPASAAGTRRTRRIRLPTAVAWMAATPGASRLLRGSRSRMRRLLTIEHGKA
ncbi:hypothetical protein QCN29_02970 [Streptomyces sp. HNM0663]|uniref:Uncharacterized protein n=1 Tax=Streptomyces chengmaiensis TaxID=3040919 RepID=A0ABT6HHE7_9ACTN|nr:hypothetical protein [Streptomyces chengmaiensis]MDH2387766.1 hypothetical protein [Streptomyces chengmaiensis]